MLKNTSKGIYNINSKRRIIMNKSLRVPTSINMNVVLYKEFRKKCIDLDLKYSHVVEMLVKEWLKKGE